jgi:histidyl-tRNA synthetase
VVVIGEEERASSTAQLKDMRSSVQERVALAELPAKARERLGAASGAGASGA